MSKVTKFQKLIKRAFKERNKQTLDRVLLDAYKNLGEKETERILKDDILPNLSLDEQKWWMDTMPQHIQHEIGEKARQAVVQILIDAGFEFGKDFSVSSDMVAVSDRAKEHLLEHIPPERRQEIESQLVSMDSNPYELINQQVGVDFFSNLVKVARSRLAGITDAQASGYLNNIVTGITVKHPELEGFGEWFLLQVLSKQRLDRISKLEDEGDLEEDDYSFFMEDILVALERESLIRREEVNGQTKTMMATEGFKAINRVWESDTVPLREVIAKLDQKQRENKK